jgi:hypothetical protein
LRVSHSLNIAGRCEGLVGETADGNLLVKPGLGATTVSRDGRCSTIAVRAVSVSAALVGQKETPGVILRGFVVELTRALDVRGTGN